MYNVLYISLLGKVLNFVFSSDKGIKFTFQIIILTEFQGIFGGGAGGRFNLQPLFLQL